jgi:hypothetical protein
MAFCSLAISFLAGVGTMVLHAQQPDTSTVVQRIDAAIQARFENVLAFTVTEHYAVYRNHDEVHPAAEMTVKATYNKQTGKTYNILSQSGSGTIRNLVLNPLLDNEKRINLPGNREQFWFTSANYEMKLKPGGIQRVDGRDCLAVSMAPKQRAPNLLNGTLWVDAKDYSTVLIQGTSSKSPSIFTGPTQMMRHYANVSGYAQATHARAVSNSNLIGQTIITIDYSNYQVQLRPDR